MATPTDVSINIDHQLRMLAADIADMRTLLSTWDTAPPPERLSWEAEWPAVAAMLSLLCGLQGDNALTDAQGQALSVLTEHARSLAPMLRERGFTVPAIG